MTLELALVLELAIVVNLAVKNEIETADAGLSSVRYRHP